jgi:hypothetical protein
VKERFPIAYLCASFEGPPEQEEARMNTSSMVATCVLVTSNRQYCVCQCRRSLAAFPEYLYLSSICTAAFTFVYRCVLR